MSTMQITEIPIGDLRENPNNPRRHIDAKKLSELAASIREKGIRQPLEVREVDLHKKKAVTGTYYEVVFGNRRFKAAVLAGLTVVPAIIRELTDDEAFEIAVTENVQRDDMTALDEAGAYDALVKRGSTVAAVAARFGKTESHVYRRIKLLQLVDEIQDALDEGRLTLGHAERLARMSPELQREAFDPHNGCVWDFRPFLVAGDSEDDEILGLDNLRPAHELDAFMRRKMAIAPTHRAMDEITRIVGLDELVPDTRAGKRATAARREARRVAGEASRAASAATLDVRARVHAAQQRKGAKGWRNPGNQIAMAPPTPAPGGSWWLGLDAQAFAARASDEQARMQRHKFGGTSTAVVEDAS